MKYPPKQDLQCSECGAFIRKRPSPTGRIYCDTGCKAAWQRRARPVTSEWLRQQYLDEGRSANDIAKIVHRDPKRVWEWLRDDGVALRPRGHDERHRFKKGQQSTFIGRRHSEETKKKLSDIAKAQGRVPYDPSVGSYMKGRKGKDTPNWKGGVTPERQACYSSVEWKEAVKAVWKRADAKCERCGMHHNSAPTRGTFHIHHIVGFADSSKRCMVANLALLCSKCHKFVHSKANKDGEWLK